MMALITLMTGAGCEQHDLQHRNANAPIHTGVEQPSQRLPADASNTSTSTNTPSKDAAMTSSSSDSATATLRVYNAQGQLAPAATLPKVILTKEQWKEKLTEEQFRVLRFHGTEAAFCGGLLNNKEAGVYVCAGCALPLFQSNTKFESGTGWPSFYQPIAKENILEVMDYSYGMTRVEIRCARCDGHLGHVFEDGPRPTGLRYCLNSAAMNFVPETKLATLAE